MYEAGASCKDIARAPATNWEPHCVTLAGYCYAVRHGIKVQLVTPYRVSHLQPYGVTVRCNVTSVYPPEYFHCLSCWMLASGTQFNHLAAEKVRRKPYVTSRFPSLVFLFSNHLVFSGYCAAYLSQSGHSHVTISLCLHESLVISVSRHPVSRTQLIMWPFQESCKAYSGCFIVGCTVTCLVMFH